MAVGLDNCFVKGTQGIPIPGNQEVSSFPVPANNDWFWFGKVVSYDDALEKVTVRNIWDPTNAQDFYAWAKYLARDGTPSEDEVVADTFCLVARTGKGNNNFSSAPTGFVLDSESPGTDKASFVAFFFTV